jgi:hypothetical protein
MKTVILKSFDNYFSANIILSRLKEEGVEAFLVDEYTSTINPIIGNIIGGIKLAVDIRDQEKAISLLNIFHEEYMKAAACPNCNMNTIIQVPARTGKSVITAILTWFFGNYAVPAEMLYHCTNCGYENSNLPVNTISEN